MSRDSATSKLMAGTGKRDRMARPALSARAAPPAPRGVSGADGHPGGEGGALLRRGPHGDRAAVGAGDLGADVQAQPEPFARGGAAPERREHLVDAVGGDR